MAKVCSLLSRGTQRGANCIPRIRIVFCSCREKRMILMNIDVMLNGWIKSVKAAF